MIAFSFALAEFLKQSFDEDSQVELHFSLFFTAVSVDIFYLDHLRNDSGDGDKSVKIIADNGVEERVVEVLLDIDVNFVLELGVFGNDAPGEMAKNLNHSSCSFILDRNLSLYSDLFFNLIIALCINLSHLSAVGCQKVKNFTFERQVEMRVSVSQLLHFALE